MKKIFVGLTAGVLFVAFTVCLAFAQGSQGPVPGHPGMGMEMEHPLWLDLPRLNIDKNRMDAIREIEVRTAKDAIRKKAELQIASIELRELLGKDPVNMGAVEAKLKQIASLRTEIQLSRIRAVEEVKGKLTSEERKKLRESLETARMRAVPFRDAIKGPGSCDQPFPPKKIPDEKKPPRGKEKMR